MTTSRRFRCRIGLGRVPGSAFVRIPWTLLLVLEFRKISIIELELLLRQAPRRPRLKVAAHHSIQLGYLVGFWSICSAAG